MFYSVLFSIAFILVLLYTVCILDLGYNYIYSLLKFFGHWTLNKYYYVETGACQDGTL